MLTIIARIMSPGTVWKWNKPVKFSEETLESLRRAIKKSLNWGFQIWKTPQLISVTGGNYQTDVCQPCTTPKLSLMLSSKATNDP